MNRLAIRTTLLLVPTFLFFITPAFAQDFTIVSDQTKACIVYDAGGAVTDSITAHLLAQDVQRVTGYLPKVYTQLADASGNAIVIGNEHSPMINSVCGNRFSKYKTLKGQWECYALTTLKQPLPNIANALLIIGSDIRGTAYGVFAISEKMGVSPWYWWADVPVVQKKELIIRQNEFISQPPSVKYRGIFLNDEDWGLQPWAAKTFEPETGDIGPKTYAKIFELLLRLKANLIWPAMHPCTKAFYAIEGNKKAAADFSIIIGSSHAEPMLRNNVGEWNSKTMGDFNYITNRETVYRYWEERVKESLNNDVIYTLGMRGVHDSGIEGVKTTREAVPLLARIIGDQRKLLTTYIDTNVLNIPQAFTAYKEVLDIYDNGLKIPDDVTLVWPDDNYGYIQRLNNAEEQKRPGGAGVYYHASYWGRPHDYLWLSSTHPALMTEEMVKAYDNQANRLWVLNVGDIKPLEYNITLFLDMAYDIKPFKNPDHTLRHLHNWYCNLFGESYGINTTNIMWEYYRLAFERRPEFMGWSQTEPTTGTTYTAYNHFYYGDEAQSRLKRYQAIENAVTKMFSYISKENHDAFYELVYYPVLGASMMNKKFLYRDKAHLYSLQNRMSAKDYAAASQRAYDSIVAATAYYNNELAGGKWKNMMSMKPRNLPVFDMPALPVAPIDQTIKWGIAAEGDSSANRSFPVFNALVPRTYFLDVFLCDSSALSFTATPSDNWIVISQQQGSLTPVTGKNELRLFVHIDWSKAPKEEKLYGHITFEGDGKTIILGISAFNPDNATLQNFKGAVETNGYISLYAGHYAEKKDVAQAKWQASPLGRSGLSLLAQYSGEQSLTDTTQIKERAAYVQYNLYTFTACSPTISIFAVPTHPLNTHYSMRYAIQLDNGPIQILDFKTTGRSDTWKQNVLTNNAIKQATLQHIQPGRHTLKVFITDPGVVLDRFTIDLGGLQPAYGLIPETIIL